MHRIKGISHITLICRDIEKSALLFKEIFEAKEVYSSEAGNFSLSKEKFFVVCDLWIALMEGEPLERSYNHIAFEVEETDLPFFELKIQSLELSLLPSRDRHPQEGQSIYFYDYDNHLFELHAGNLSTRLDFYERHFNSCQ